MADDDAAADRAPAPSPARAGRFDVLIDVLFASHFHGHPSMRDTDAFNHALAFRDLVKERLAKETDQ